MATIGVVLLSVSKLGIFAKSGPWVVNLIAKCNVLAKFYLSVDVWHPTENNHGVDLKLFSFSRTNKLIWDE